jgi:predicted MFS family arabinose efflux permease
MSQIQALAPFRVRSFRFQWPADLLTSCAFEMELLILGWYILVETGSVLLLTIFASLLYVGTLISPMFGVVGDRTGQRNLLFAMRAIYTVLAATLATLAFTHVLSPAYVFIIASLMGLVRPSDLGVRGALVASTVPNDHLIGAMSISRMTQDSARIAGALTGAGLFVAFGMGPSYVAITCCYALGALLLAGAAPESNEHRLAAAALGSARTSPWHDLKAGLTHVWNTPLLNAALWIAFLVNLTGFPFMTGLMPYVAKSVYGTDQTGLGYLVASFAGGALIGSIALTMARDWMRAERVMIGSIVIWHVLLILFAGLRDMGAGLACLMTIGFMQSIGMIALAVILMRTAAPQFRGRVMGVRMLAIYGNPLGMLIAGALVERIGFTVTASLYGVVGLAVMFFIVMLWRADIWPSPAQARV